MYDSNLTIDIDSTTYTTYHGTVVIATQNASTTSMGTAHLVRVYNDEDGHITDNLRVVWTSGSANYDVYFVPPAWSKNLIHIRACGASCSTPSEICTIQSGTAPSTTSGLEPTNVFSTSVSSAINNAIGNAISASY